MEKLICTIVGMTYVAAILIGIIGQVTVALDSALREMEEMVETPAVVTNGTGIQFQMAQNYEAPHCTAIAAKVAMAYYGYDVDARQIADATCIPGTDCEALGRYMHNVADAALEQSDDDQLHRNLSQATNIEELVAEMTADHATAAIVSVDVPQYYHAVAVVIEKDGSWHVVDAAMTTTLVYGGTDYAKIDAWSGELRRGQNWYFTRSQM